MTIRTQSARLLLSLFMLSGISAFATNRTFTLSAPATIRPGASIHVIVSAGTDANDGEEIGFLHSEYSTDSGQTWTPVYAEKVGRSVTRAFDFLAGADGSKAMVRSRIAFRGGKAGDVDYLGAPIVWGVSWGKWTSPPARSAVIVVTTK